MYQDRKNLAATLKDTKTVVGTLERIMAVVIQLAFFFIYLLIWNVRVVLPDIYVSRPLAVGSPKLPSTCSCGYR